MAAKGKSSAGGEIAAIGGYLNQYEYAACVLYTLMQSGDLEAITLGEATAGVFDDLLLHTKGEVHGTQVKSAKNVRYVSLATEFAAEGFLHELVKSWQDLELKFGRGKIRLKYIFSGLFSDSDTSLANDGASGARHSAEFARFISRTDLDQEIIESSVWSAKLEELRELANLEWPEFVRFLSDLTICDVGELQRNRIEIFPPADRRRLGALRDILPVLVAGATSKQRWTETELVEKLGWRTRLSQYNLHEFPIPADFQENTATEAQLINTIRGCESGYVSLIGPPGTGKSTLLQRELYSTSEYSISRYLAFHPDHRHGLGRAEAGEFLNDLISDLRSHGFSASTFARDDTSGLRAELKDQLEQASRVYEHTGRKTIIVIDGLDHVPREETPQSSFLKELPAANAVPKGVLFVLGTQQLNLADLHPTIPQQASEPERCVKVDPLSKEAVFGMAAAAGLPEYVDRGELYDACGGHPLTARYFIEALKQATSAENATRILSNADGLGRSLAQIYDRVWKKLDTADDAKSALGLIARAEGTLSPEQLAEVSSVSAVEEVLEKASFLLSLEESGRIAIFHNSFRLFVASATGLRFGKPSPDLEKKFNERLAQIAASADETDPQHWMELRYRARAGSQDEVLRIGSAEYFRASLAAFRVARDIYTDLRLTYAAVHPTRDRVLLLNKLLIDKEIEYRLEAVRELDLIGLYMDIGDEELAIELALDGNSSDDGWMRLADRLWVDGRHETARRIFEANNPLELMFKDDGFSLAQAKEWFQQAHRFRSIPKLVALIQSLSTKAGASEFVANDLHRGAETLKFWLAAGIITDRPEVDLKELRELPSFDDADAAALTAHAASEAFRSFDDTLARTKLRELVEMPGLLDVHFSWRTAAAITALKLNEQELAARLAQDLRVPDLADLDLDPNHTFRARQIYETFVVAAKTGVPISENESSDERSAFLAKAVQKIRELAELRVAAEGSDATTIVRQLKTIIRFFATEKPDAYDTLGYRFYALLGWLPNPIVRIASQLGTDATAQIVAFVDERLAEASNLSGSQPFQLKFARLVHILDDNTEQARVRIENACQTLNTGRTPHEVVESYTALARALSSVGLQEAATATLRDMHQHTLGYWLRAKKEPQYQFWKWSFIEACKEAPESAAGNALEFARFTLGMDQTEGDETAMRLIADLLLGAGADPDVLAGVTQRLFESDLTTWARLADSFLAALIAHSQQLAEPAFAGFTRLVVPFLGENTSRCVPGFFASVGPAGEPDVVNELIASANRFCPISKRYELLSLITTTAPGLREGLLPDLEKSKELDRKASQEDGGYGTSAPVEIGAASLPALLEHGDGRTSYGNGLDYAYAKAASRLAAMASKDEIDAFLSARPHVAQDTKFLAACSKRMLILGQAAAARRFFDLADKAAARGYWSSFYGGEKLALQKLRIELDGDAGREAGFDQLLTELASGVVSGANLFLNLEDVLGLVSVTLPYQALWRETEAHLKQYREYALAAPVEPIGEIDSHADALAFIFAMGFSFPCSEVLYHVRAAVALVAEYEIGEEFLRKLFELRQRQSSGDREVAALLFRICEIGHLRQFIATESKTLVSNDDFVVARLAESTLQALNEPYDEPTGTELPPFYTLHVAEPEADDSETRSRRPGGPRLWSDDPWTWTEPLLFAFRILRRSSEIPETMLRRRCAEFMRREGGRSAFGPEVAQAIRELLGRLSLRYNYALPLPVAASRGFGKVLQELYLADEMDTQVLPFIWPEIGGPATSILTLEPERRPDWLHFPEGPSRFGGIDKDEWPELGADSLYSSVVAEEFVFAEHSTFTYSDIGERAKCERFFLPAGCGLIEDLEDLPQLVAGDSFIPRYSDRDSKLVAAIPNDRYGTLLRTTITVCPYAARVLGWQRSMENGFELFDTNERPVARTLHWVDGTAGGGRNGTEKFAAGSVVLLTELGREQLQERFGPLARRLRIARSVDSGRRGNVLNFIEVDYP